MKYDILHTADWHLWHKHKYTRLVPNRHWDSMFEAKLDVLRRTFVTFVDEHDVDRFVIAGDVFDHYNPIEPVRREFVALINEISAYVGKVLILVGNHDQYKGQIALESVKEAIGASKNIQIFNKPFVTYFDEKSIKVDHIGVEGFYANGSYQEPPDRLKSRSDYERNGFVLLGHYHKYQANSKFVYSGSPYPVNFGEQDEDKYFVTYNFGKKIKFHKWLIEDGIKFITNPKKELKDTYVVVRLKNECAPEKEKELKRELLAHKEGLLTYKNVLDVIIDLKVIKSSIAEKIKKGDTSILDYKEIISKLKLDDRFNKYIHQKFEEIEE